jgi:hypothetical protein
MLRTGLYTLCGLMLLAAPSMAQSLLNNGRQSGGSGSLIGPQVPFYSGSPRMHYPPCRDNQIEFGRAKDSYRDSAGGPHRPSGYR